MQELPNVTPHEIPVYLQALLNIIAFLVAAVAVWYAYFIKGIRASKTESITGFRLPFDDRFVERFGEDIGRMADATEHIKTSIQSIKETMRKSADEAEIERRVSERIKARGREQDEP